MYFPTLAASLMLLGQLIGFSSALSPLTHYDSLTDDSISAHRLLKRQFSTSKWTGPKVPSFNMSIPIDHFDTANTRTYNNRYWVNDTYWKPGGPVFFFDGGESGLTEKGAAQWLAEYNATSSVMRLAAKYNGIAVLFEHRYYGLSLPVPTNRSTNEPVGGIAGYKYLTVEQALEDIVYFSKNFKPAGCTGDECTAVAPSKAPWIFIGGSYPGVRAALMRIRNPEIFYASWASSAPVQAVVDGSIYYNPIEDTLPSNCSADIKAAIKVADEIMDGKYGADAYTQLQRLTDVASSTATSITRNYTLSSASYWTRFEIGRLMARALITGFQYAGPTTTTHRLCNYIQSYNPTAHGTNTRDDYISVLSNPGNRPFTSTGISTTYNSTIALQAYFYGWRRWYEQYYKDLLNKTTTTGDSIPNADSDDRAWLYQVITEFGWFQASNPDNITIVSKYYNYTSQRGSLINYYRSPITSSSFPSQPNITTINKYGGWNMNPSNTMFTDGQFDPWRSGSPMSNQPWIDAPLREVVQDVPACNVSPKDKTVFGLVYDGEVHVPDLAQSLRYKYDETSAVYRGVTLFGKALDVWLPCFKKA